MLECLQALHDEAHDRGVVRVARSRGQEDQSGQQEEGDKRRHVDTVCGRSESARATEGAL